MRFNDQELPRTVQESQLWVTEIVDTARGAMVVVATIDSSQNLSAVQGTHPVHSGRGPDLTWTIDTLRRVLPAATGSNLLASLIPPLTIGTIRFPDDSVGIGTRWATPIAMRVGHFLEAVSTVRGDADARIEGMWVSGPDTVVRIHLHVPFRGDEVPAPDPAQPQRLTGVFDGMEDFSLSRGVTLKIDLHATAQLEINQRTPLGTLVPPVHLAFRVSRDLQVYQ